MNVPALLGIDGGGTSTTAWLADRDGTVLGKGQGGPSNLKAVGPQKAQAGLAAAIGGAFSSARLEQVPVDVACFGLAGFDRPEDKRLLAAWSMRHEWARKLLVENDGALILAAGTPEGWGLGVIAGTGSIAVGRAPDGRTARAGGWGHLIGDEGSAYAVALAGLRWVARHSDGRAMRVSHDLLSDRLCDALGIRSSSELVSTIYSGEFDRARIAALAPVVVECAQSDPLISESILMPASRDLAEMVLAVARQLGWPQTVNFPVWPLALAGSFLLSSEAVASELLNTLGAQGLAVSAKRVAEPVRGALVLARQALEAAP
jgi:N-acetylglucosamine kinase-like BadF-type ATPase